MLRYKPRPRGRARGGWGEHQGDGRDCDTFRSNLSMVNVSEKCRWGCLQSVGRISPSRPGDMCGSTGRQNVCLKGHSSMASQRFGDFDSSQLLDWVIANPGHARLEEARGELLKRIERPPDAAERTHIAPGLAAAEARGKAEGRKEGETAAYLTTCVFYMIQRVRLMKRSSGSCRNCRAWEQSHLQDFGH